MQYMHSSETLKLSLFIWPIMDAAAALLAQSASISNWAEFASQNNITGWNASTPVCQWNGVTCTPQGSIIAL